MKSKPVFATMAVVLGLAGLIPIAMALDAEDKVAVCAGCHGPRGHSVVPDNPILAAQYADYLSIALKAYISGERDNRIMKTMAGRLSAEDMADIVAYYAAQPPNKSQAEAAGDAAAGKSKTAVCAGCHGPGGHGVTPMFPRLAGQHATYLAKALKAYQSGARSSSIMLTQMTAALSDQDIADIAAYYASQPPLPQAAAQPRQMQIKEGAQ
jgi:cytochrome c553